MVDFEREVTTEETNYESSERLMNEKDVLDISMILDISLNNFNNFTPLTPPMGIGAGRVKKFQDDEKAQFLTRPPMAKENLEGSHSESSVAEESIPPNGIEIMEETEELENWPHFPTSDEFEIPPEEVRRRASWAWYRTSLLCMRASQEVASRCVDVSDRSIEGHESDDESAVPIIGPAEALKKRAEKARLYALSLFPELLESDEMESPSWGKEFTDGDTDYYLEMSLNHEYNQRVYVASHYKAAAFSYIREALFLYLEWKQEMELSCSSSGPISNNPSYPSFSETPSQLNFLRGAQDSKEEKGINLNDYAQIQMILRKYGSISQLWSEAAEWASQGKDIWKCEHFRRYWRRAALARGHAEWLLREREFSEIIGHTKSIEKWRLWPPASIGQYDNDCVMVATLIGFSQKPVEGLRGGNFPYYDDDEHGTNYNIMHTVMRDSQAEKFGWPKHAFFFGPPNFVLERIAEEGLIPQLFGLIPNDQISLRISAPISVYERYLRVGIQDFLPVDAPKYDKVLATCADDILVEGCFYRHLEDTLNPRYKNSSVLEYLEVILGKVLKKRAHMTLRTATEHGFDHTIYKILKHHFNQVQIMLKRPPGPEEHEYLIFAERKLSQVLAPWFKLSLLETVGGRIVIHLYSLFTHELYGSDSYISEFSPIAEPVSQCLETVRLILLDQYLEMIREAVLGYRDIEPTVHDFLLPFRKFLESGGEPSLMPLVSTGNREKRELTKLGLFQSGRMRCKEGCRCPRPEALKGLERMLEYRLSGNVQAQFDRMAICAFFKESDGGKSAGNMWISKTRMELFERLRVK